MAVYIGDKKVNPKIGIAATDPSPAPVPTENNGLVLIPGEKTEIIWNDNVGEYILQDGEPIFCKVSDIVVPADKLIGAIIAFDDEEYYTIEESDLIVISDACVLCCDEILSSSTGEHSFMGQLISVPSDGTYFINPEFGYTPHSLTVRAASKFTQSGDDITEKMRDAIQDAALSLVSATPEAILWDGNTTDRESFDGYYYVSSTMLDPSEIIGGIITFRYLDNDGQWQEEIVKLSKYDIETYYGGSCIFVDGAVIVARAGEYNIWGNSYSLPEDGVYFSKYEDERWCEYTSCFIPSGKKSIVMNGVNVTDEIATLILGGGGVDSLIGSGDLMEDYDER